jgi:transcriptional regulator with XRE-family HTH domain
VNRRDLELIVQTRAALADQSARGRRAAAGVRQVEMAAVCGVSPSTVSQWESGLRSPGADHALAYGRALAAAERRRAA